MKCANAVILHFLTYGTVSSHARRTQYQLFIALTVSGKPASQAEVDFGRAKSRLQPTTTFAPV